MSDRQLALTSYSDLGSSGMSKPTLAQFKKMRGLESLERRLDKYADKLRAYDDSHGSKLNVPESNSSLWIMIIVVILMCYCACLCSSVLASFINTQTNQNQTTTA